MPPRVSLSIRSAQVIGLFVNLFKLKSAVGRWVGLHLKRLNLARTFDGYQGVRSQVSDHAILAPVRGGNDAVAAATRPRLRGELLSGLTESLAMNAEELVERSSDLFSLPAVCSRVSELLDDPEATEEEIADVLGHDPALTAMLLKMANTAPYARPYRVDDVVEATSRIGLDNLRALMTTTSVIDAFKAVDPDLVDMASFWHHSVCCGIAARSLAHQCGVEDTQQLFVAGLLHDIGQLLLYNSCPELAEQVLHKAGESEYFRYRAEQEIMGITHAQVGAELLRRWQLSPCLQQVVEFHHDPVRAPVFSWETSIVHIATAVANRVEPSWKMGTEQQNSPLQIQSKAWEVTGLSPTVIDSTVEEIDQESFAVLSVVNPGSLLIF